MPVFVPQSRDPFRGRGLVLSALHPFVSPLQKKDRIRNAGTQEFEQAPSEFPDFLHSSLNSLRTPAPVSRSGPGPVISALHIDSPSLSPHLLHLRSPLLIRGTRAKPTPAYPPASAEKHACRSALSRD
jgi:hypothetical protein